MAASNGGYWEELINLFIAFNFAVDVSNKSFILYGIAVTYDNKGDDVWALRFYHKAIELNSGLIEAHNNIAFFNILFGKSSKYWEKRHWDSFLCRVDAKNCKIARVGFQVHKC
jgi:hypothetical protein